MKRVNVYLSETDNTREYDVCVVLWSDGIITEYVKRGTVELDDNLPQGIIQNLLQIGLTEVD